MIKSNYPSSTVGPRLSEPQLSEPLIMQTVRLTVLLEYFEYKCMFYWSSVCSIPEDILLQKRVKILNQN